MLGAWRLADVANPIKGGVAVSHPTEKRVALPTKTAAEPSEPAGTHLFLALNGNRTGRGMTGAASGDAETT